MSLASNNVTSICLLTVIMIVLISEASQMSTSNVARARLRWAFNFGLWRPTKEEWMLAAQCIQTEEKNRIEKFVFKKDAKSAMVRLRSTLPTCTYRYPNKIGGGGGWGMRTTPFSETSLKLTVKICRKRPPFQNCGDAPENVLKITDPSGVIIV
jgi:hypothetical protein